VVLRRAQLDPVHAAALVATGSMVVYVPFYVALHGLHFAGVSSTTLIVQVVFQGIVVTIISLVLYARAVAILGASRASAFGALVPALSGLFAIPLLAEWPTTAGWVAIALISGGVYLASQGRSSRR
jgi:drug/metabolite transporter (DMT)-like permease